MKKKSPWWLAWLWGLNLTLAGGLLAAFLFLDGLPQIPAGATITSAPGIAFTVTPVNTATPFTAPTATRKPRPTAAPPTVTPTPTRLPYGEGPITIGFSAGGRPLQIFKFGNGPKVRMIVAGIHGGYEWNTIALADEMIAYLAGQPHLIPDDVTLYILRSLNPDGEARSHDENGRVNNNGVDLNRNWPASTWVADWDRANCWNQTETTSGTHPGSEPETVALMLFLSIHKPQALISYHSAALGIFPGGTPPDPDSVRLAEQLSEVMPYPYPPLDIGCEYTGTLADWAAEHGIAAVDMELTNHVETDFDLNLRALQVLIDWEDEE